MVMKKKAKDKKAVKEKEQIEEKTRTAKKTSSPAGKAGEAAKAKPGVPQKAAAGEAPGTGVSGGAVTPRAEGALAGRPQYGESPVVPVKPSQEKTVTIKQAKAEKAPAAGRSGAPGIKKEYSALRDICKVTFNLPAAAAPAARRVTIVGDFNGWNRDADSLSRQVNGDFAVTLDLAAGREYRFRYLIDGHRWENDWRADKYVRSPYGVDDSVVCV